MSHEEDLLVAVQNIHQVLIHLVGIIEGKADASVISAEPAAAPFMSLPNPPAPAQEPTPISTINAPVNGSDDYIDFEIDTITYSTDDNGNPVFKGRGYPYQAYGVRIWPEVFVRLGVPIESLALGENKIDPLFVHAQLNENGNPKKIVGFATGPRPTEPHNDLPPIEPSHTNGDDIPPFPEPYPQRTIRGSNIKNDEIPF